MAEGLLRELGGGRFEVESAGTRPGGVRPEAVEAMREAGVDISSHRSKSVDEFAGREFDYVITVCDNAAANCPVFPGKAERVHHGFEDPAAVAGGWDERLAAFRRVREELAGWLRAWAAGVDSA
jgi:arsenate reductase